jgi:hypothetical protein
VRAARATRSAALAAALLTAAPAAARPPYFEALAASFGFGEGDRLYACGVCHYRWEGTGPRNPFGSSVEQQLYLGKPIAQAIQDAGAGDPDGDGFTSLEELATHETLPGYSCANFFDAVGAPSNWHEFVTPGVASCLEPKDVRVAPEAVTFTTFAATSETQAVLVFNNGSDFPIEVTAYGLLPGAHAALSVTGPAAPFTLNTGEHAELGLTFAPTGAAFANATLRIESDDPDEPAVDVSVEAIGVVRPLAAPAVRAACLRDVERAVRRYARLQLRAVLRCQGDEARGVACDAGRRDLELLRAEARLRASLGGVRDRRCAAADLSPTLVGHADQCGGGCAAIELDDFADLADCVVCRQREEADALLGAVLGAAPPDLPPVAPTAGAERCQASLLAGAQKAAGKAQALLGRCALANVTAAEPSDCAAAHAADLAAIAADPAARLARCADTTGLEGCFAADPPACLGTAALTAASDLVEAGLGTVLRNEEIPPTE